jgi:hypothetical protein
MSEDVKIIDMRNLIENFFDGKIVTEDMINRMRDVGLLTDEECKVALQYYLGK